MILISGANGQLGYDFQRLFDEIKEEYIATDVNDLDITDIEKVREFVKDKNISLIINCAAYNNVDKAEDEPELCRKLNTYAPRDLAIIANEIGADYITYSTDFVFDGKKKTPYTEEDIPNPLSVYGKTKFEGEKEVFRIKPDSFVIRTSWVFGIANNNFNKQVINWSKSKEELSIVDDQISSPTYSKDLAYYSWELIKTKKYGLYHLSNDGEASKYDQAEYVLDKIDWQGKLNRAKTKDFNLKAERAEYTKLDSSKLEKTINMRLPSWKNGIDKFLKGKKLSDKKLTIAIPTYNREEALKKTLLNIFPQLTDEVILLIIDNKSNYDIEKLVYNICPENHLNKIKIIKNKYNIGANANIMRCFEEVTTKWMWLLGDDDIVLSDAIETILYDIKIQEEQVVLLKYSSPISQEKNNKMITGLENLINFLSETTSEKRFGNLLFISSSIYKVKEIKEFINKGYQYVGSFAPHIMMLFYFLNKYNKKSIYFLKNEIVHLEEIRETYSSLNVGLGLIYSTKNIFFNISKETDRKLRRLFNLFTYDIKNNFIQLYFYGNKEKLIYDYKTIFKDLYMYSKNLYSIKEKTIFYILYFMIDKPIFIKLAQKVSNKFKKALEKYNKNFEARI